MGPWHRTDSWDSFSRMRSILFRERAELHRTDREILHRRRPEDPETSSPDPKRQHMDIENSDADPETSDTDPETSDTDPEARIYPKAKKWPGLEQERRRLERLPRQRL